jgi:hypothetical protein
MRCSMLAALFTLTFTADLRADGHLLESRELLPRKPAGEFTPRMPLDRDYPAPVCPAPDRLEQATLATPLVFTALAAERRHVACSWRTSCRSFR